MKKMFGKPAPEGVIRVVTIPPLRLFFQKNRQTKPLPHLREFGHGGHWDLSVISGPRGRRRAGVREKEEGSQTPFDPEGVGG